MDNQERNFSGVRPIENMAWVELSVCKGRLPVNISTTVHPILLGKGWVRKEGGEAEQWKEEGREGPES